MKVFIIPCALCMLYYTSKTKKVQPCSYRFINIFASVPCISVFSHNTRYSSGMIRGGVGQC